MLEESLKFARLLGSRRRPQTTCIQTYDRNHWFDGSYRTVQRTVAAGKFTKSEKRNCANQIFEIFSTFKAQHFDAQIKQLIGDIAEKYPVSIGQSQKIVNILLKYHACRYYAKIDLSWNQSNEWVSAIHSQQHVPIDSIVLISLFRLAPSACANFLTTNGRVIHSSHSYDFNCNGNASIYMPASKTNKRSSIPWSKIPDYETYFRIQEIIRELAANKKLSPLLYEMRHLWNPN